MRPVVIAVLVCCSCAVGRTAGGGDALSAAVIGTTAAALAAIGSRASGGCYASCPVGTTCNRHSGLCDALPCHGQCGANETCVNAGWFNEHCEPGRTKVLPPPRKTAERSPEW